MADRSGERGRGGGSGTGGKGRRTADPAELGRVLARYRERPTMGKLAMTVVPAVAFFLFLGESFATHGIGHLVFDAVCVLLSVWGAVRLIRSFASWLDLYEDGIVYRGRHRVRWAYKWEEFHDVTLTREATYVNGSSRPLSDKVVARMETAPGPGIEELSGNYFLPDLGGGFLHTFLRSTGNLTSMFPGIVDRVVEARVRLVLRELAEGGDVRYSPFEIGATYFYLDGAADEIPWDEVTRIGVGDDEIAITVPHLLRRMEGVKLKADGSRDNYRVGRDNTLYIGSKGMSRCRKEIIWSVMTHIADSLEADRDKGADTQLR
ncbi:hypothetical protein AB0E67_09890 [Streptomyces sp. NPDC032161]|uniref:hypothetical protein n=1 Tax=unclassified Streptomyces TaxID=2593676 RepID=UPI0033DC9C0C